MRFRIQSLSETRSSLAAPPKTRPSLAMALATLAVAVLPLLGAGPASALYPPDGLKSDGAGGYMNPDDGMCVIGLKQDGTMLVDWSITNARDCVAWTRSADGSVDLAGMNTQAACLNATDPVVAPNDGYRHAWSTSLCYDAVNQRGISRVDLDNTDAMCIAKGGTVVTTGKCVAYGWVYRNRKADGSLPVTGTGISTTDGVQETDGLGWCYQQMRMTATNADGGSYNSAATCPSKYNFHSTCAGGTNPGTPCTSSTACTGGGTCSVRNLVDWPACDSSTTGCQTQAAYDAGLGWSYSSGQCIYAYGLQGPLAGSGSSTSTRANGTTVAAGTVVDLTAYDNQGDCLANGGLWDNWLPNPADEQTSAQNPGLPNNRRVMRLDALHEVDEGGGDFYSGTGAVCQKCHADQSRSYQERDKPGFYKTRHRNAGDAVGEPFQPFFTEAGSAWGLQGVQCAMCHSTAKPAQDDLIQVVPAGVVGPPAAGAPKSASGHNQTEYGSHLVAICYTCHGQAAVPSTDNPASVIPASAGELALTDKGLAPITNMFLNSPHAKYSGTSAKVDVGNKDNYDSHFGGYVCRTPATVFRSSASPGDSQANCQAAGHTWYTDKTPNYCYYNQTSCQALATGQWKTTFDAAAYPFAVGNGTAAGGPGGVCAGVGIGSIIVTYYRDGEAHRLHNVNSSVNPDCTNPAVAGSPTSGAAGYWVRDGETSPGVPADTAQGTCMTCHDVHWALADEDPEAEPLRRECTTCHAKDLNKIRHPFGGGTPLEAMDTHPNEACETCHMPNKMHLFRVSSSDSYSTFPPASGSGTQLNSLADGDYAEASWVDVDLSCGQCHGGGSAHAVTTGSIASGTNTLNVAAATGLAPDQRILVAGAGEGGADLETFIAGVSGLSITLVADAATTVADAAVEQNPLKNNALYFNKTQLARRARRIHNDAPAVRFSYTFGSPNTLVVNVDAGRTVCSGGPCDSYEWNWGDGSPTESGVTASHEYAAGGTYPITLTVEEWGVGSGSRTKNVAVTEPDYGPTVDSTCGFDANTWTLTITDSSTDDNGLARETVNWGDGSMLTVDESVPFGPYVHTYGTKGTWTATHRVTDTIGQSDQKTCVVSPAPFTISGTVFQSNGTTVVPAATVQLKIGTVVKRTVSTNSLGVFSVGNLKPATYTVTVTKSGYTFGAPASIQVGPSSAGNVINAVNP